MKKTIAAVVLAVSTLFATGCGSEENIGYINRQKVMAEAPQMIAILEEGNKKLDEADAEMKSALDANPDMSDEDRNKIRAEHERKTIGIGTAYNTQIQQKLDSVLVDICKEKNISIVMDNSVEKVLVSGGIDLTNDVINKLK